MIKVVKNSLIRNRKVKKHSKRYKKNKEIVLNKKDYSLSEAIKTLKSINKVKFDESIEIAVVLNKEKNKGEGLSRGYSKLPHGTGKKTKIGVFAPNDKIDEAKKAGADVVGNDDLIKKVKEGKIDFDIAISTPEMMKSLGVLGEKLGPLGIMPNPKTGTVTENLSKAIKDIKEGQIQFKSEKGGIVHSGIGKVSFSDENLISNIETFINAIKNSKPDTIKGQFINKIFISSSMGPSIKIASLK